MYSPWGIVAFIGLAWGIENRYLGVGNVSNKILFDTSGILSEVYRNRTLFNDAKKKFKEIQSLGGSTFLYFKADIWNRDLTELQSMADLFYKLRSENQQLLVSLRFNDSQPASNGFFRNHREKDEGKKLNGDLIHFINKYSVIIGGISFLRSSQLAQLKLEVKSIKDYVNRNHSEIQIGYVLDKNCLQCGINTTNIYHADFLIVNVGLTLNDNLFVESYGIFNNSLNYITDTITNWLLALKFDAARIPVYLKIQLNAYQTRENLQLYTLRDNGYKAFWGAQRKIELRNAIEVLKSSEIKTVARYQYLLTKYIDQWTAEMTSSSNIILDYQSVKNFLSLRNDSQNNHWLKSTLEIIPYITNVPIVQNSNEILHGIKLYESAEILLNDFSASGFDTVMIDGVTWKQLLKSARFKPCNRSPCTPKNVIYQIDQPEPFLYPIHQSIQKLNSFSGMNVNAIYFSSKYYSYPSWSKILPRFFQVAQVNSSLNNIPTTACYSRIHDVLNNINLRCDEACYGNELRQIQGCEALQSVSGVIWPFKVYFINGNVVQFVERIMKRLESLIIGRQLFSAQYPGKTVILQIQGINLIDKNIGSGLYCNDIGAKLNHFYESIITWMKIHDFPVIFEPARGVENFGNPLIWEPLKLQVVDTDRQRRMTYVMESGPIFVRRKQSTATIFGGWSKGMYPCIKKTTDPKNAADLDIGNEFVGVTVNLDIRQTAKLYTANEVQTMLLLPLQKFRVVEINIDSCLDVLTSVVNHPNFVTSLRGFMIFPKTVYLRIKSVNLRVKVTRKLNKLAAKLTKVGFKVHITVNNNLEYDVTKLAKLQYKVGIAHYDCTNLAYKIVLGNRTLEEKLTKVHYLICDTDTVLAKNHDEAKMTDYFNTHLYLTKLIQHFYPNLKAIHFRVQAFYSGETLENKTTNLVHFLADVINYANAYKVHYILLPAYALEDHKEQTSFWKIKNYADLSNLNNFEETLSKVLDYNVSFPKITHIKDETIYSINTTNEATPSSTITTTNHQFSNFTTGFKTEAVTKSTRNNETEHESTSKTNISNVNSTSNANVNNVPGINSESTIWSKILALPKEVLYTICTLLSVGVIVIVTVLIYRNRHFLTTAEMSEFYNGQQAVNQKAIQDREHNKKYSGNFFDGLMYLQKYEVAKQDIEVDFKNALNKDRLYYMYRGRSNAMQKEVIVHISKRCSKDNFKKMLSELKLLCYIGEHANLTCLVGYYTKEIRNCVVWIITEFCENGSLLDYIKSIDGTGKNSVHDLVRFCCEIASGMQYLAEQDVVYGSISAKCVLLDKNLTCKIKAFGLLGKVQEYKTLVKSKQVEKMPWQWMAPETLTKLEFTSKSDVWSFGMTAWEIFSLGRVPFSDCMPDINYFEALESERVCLDCPLLATNQIYENILKCYQVKPTRRPDFKDLMDCFSAMILKGARTQFSEC